MATSLTAIFVGIATTLGSGAAIALLRYLRQHGQDHEETQRRLERIEAEFSPNGGHSHRDLMEDVLRNVRHLAAAQGVQMPPRRSRPRRDADG